MPNLDEVAKLTKFPINELLFGVINPPTLSAFFSSNDLTNFVT